MIIFEGEEIVLHYNKGNSPYVLVSFIGAYHEAETAWNYLCRDYAEANDVTCLGFTSKVRNFFVSSEMPQALEVARSHIAGHQAVISVGQSMGGYACLRYSREIGATHVISSSPFYSLDPDDLKITKTKYMEHYHKSLLEGGVVFTDLMKGMRIEEQHCSGRIFVVYDPLQSTDAYNAGLCLQNSGHSYAVPMVGVGHAIIFASRPESPPLGRMIDIVLQADEDVVHREMKRFLGTSHYAITRLLSAASRKHPLLALRALACGRVVECADHDEIANDFSLGYPLVPALYVRGLDLQSYAHLLRTLRRELGYAPQQSLAKTLDDIRADTSPAATEFLLLSAHGTFLAYDLNERRLLLVAGLGARPGVVLVHLSRTDGAPSLWVTTGNKKAQVLVRGGEVSLLPDEKKAGMAVLVDANRMVALYDEDAGFLSARNDMTVHTRALSVYGWEQFALVPVIAASSPISTSAASASSLLPAQAPSPADRRVEAPQEGAPDSQAQAPMTWIAKQHARNAFDSAEKADLPVLLDKAGQGLSRPRKGWIASLLQRRAS